MEAGYERARALVDEVRERLAGPLPRLEGGVGAEPEFTPNMPREAFEAMVARIVEYVHAGDAFQVVPSQRWTAEVDADPFSVYRGLRAINPSPYMYFLDFEDFQIVGASPEPLVTVSGGRATTRPIAGTRPRGGDAEEDEAIAAEQYVNAEAGGHEPFAQTALPIKNRPLPHPRSTTSGARRPKNFSGSNGSDGFHLSAVFVH